MTDEPTPALALECVDLHVRYGTFMAVDGVSLVARPGEILGLLGPNGAGKTSVVRAITTIVPVTSGTILVNGHDLTDPVAIRTSIGVLPESNGYPGIQTAKAHLTFYAELFGLDPREARRQAEHRLRQLGLDDKSQPIGTFSRGMRQRLGLARALINRPAVLLLDEPTLGLDPAGREDLLRQLASSAVEEGTCVILCSHQLDEVERVCDRVAVMDHGRIVADGTVDHVVAGSGVTQRARIRVALGDVLAADEVLRALPAVSAVEYDNARPGDIDVELAPVDGARSQLLKVLLDARIEPRAFDFQRAALSDAFLALTSRGRETE
ncbi:MULTISPECIES: ABC transporter ATP-binding protein [unclassified Nocardioides]|uniref:ABC transporter ATP-binding protein n=1 Tax=unclassified Nocardioides TaxID=2615069 RepID=UPI0009F08D6F|nr:MULTISPECIES: ABC transporter ATP-binding protein [unclassified Nocardioides]GAW48972.1 ABC transporter related protein [Nocardioides sp. PD653-B2]GAW55187.1 ABC transporter related protein [Nocardioides sp. PD653]